MYIGFFLFFVLFLVFFFPCSFFFSFCVLFFLRGLQKNKKYGERGGESLRRKGKKGKWEKETKREKKGGETKKYSVYKSIFV